MVQDSNSMEYIAETRRDFDRFLKSIKSLLPSIFMPEIKGYITDDNGTRIKGYREIRFGYRLWRESFIPDFDFRRFFYLAGPVQAECWKLALSGQVESAAEFFTEKAMAGHSKCHIEKIARTVFMEDSYAYFLLLILSKMPKLGKIGRLLDTKPIEGANEALWTAKKRGKKTGILSMGFEEFISAHLAHYGIREEVDAIMANRLLYEDGIVTGIDKRVKNKGESLQHLLYNLGLENDGSGVVYLGDNEIDAPVFRKVEYPVVAPNAKKKFRERCLEDPDFGKRVFAPKDYFEVARKYGLE